MTLITFNLPWPPWRATGYFQFFHFPPLLFSLFKFEELSHYFNRSLYCACSLWVELISDFLLFGTSLQLPLEHKQSVPFMDITCNGNSSLLLVSLIPVLTTKISGANKNATLLYYSVYAVALWSRKNFCISLMQFRVWNTPLLQ